MTTNEMREVLADISYENWEFNIHGRYGGGAIYLQVKFWADDAVTGKPRLQLGRRWILSHHMTRSELVQTALLAVLTAIEHEARERFRYRDVAVYGPHHDVDELAVTTRLDVRV